MTLQGILSSALRRKGTNCLLSSFVHSIRFPRPYTVLSHPTSTHGRKAIENFSIDGAIAAPATALFPNGDINLNAVKGYVDFLAGRDIDGVFLNGTLGEGMSLTVEERKAAAVEWVKQGRDRLKYVMVHVGAGNLRDSIDLAKHAGSINASAIACMAPSYFKPQDEETMVEYLTQVAAAAPNTPFYYYCFNLRTGIYLNTAKVLNLASKVIPTLRGLKISSPELPSVMDCTLVCGGRMNVMIGTDEQFLTALSLNVRVPIMDGYKGKLFKRLKNAYDQGDMESARKEQHLARKLMKIGPKNDQGPPLVKAIMKCFGIDLGPVRLPLKDLPDSMVEELRKELTELGMLD